MASTAMRACVRGRSFVRRGGDGLVDRRRPELVEALTRREISDLKRKKREDETWSLIGREIAHYSDDTIGDGKHDSHNK